MDRIRSVHNSRGFQYRTSTIWVACHGLPAGTAPAPRAFVGRGTERNGWQAGRTSHFKQCTYKEIAGYNAFNLGFGNFGNSRKKGPKKRKA